MICRAMGANHFDSTRKHKLASDYSRKLSERMAWVPVNINSDETVIPVEYHGSAHINALTDAYGVMKVPVGVNEIKKGEIVDVRPI